MLIFPIVFFDGSLLPDLILPAFFRRKDVVGVFLIKKAGNIKSGSSEPSKKTIGNISILKIKEIAEIKMKDLTSKNIDAAIKIISGTAKTMGFKITKE
jgi:large subunit ribosomal protein L11